MVICNFDNHEQKSYVANLNNSNLKNNLYVAIVDTKVKNDQIYNICIYSNDINTRYNLLLKLLFAITNVKTSIELNSDIPIPIITYYNSGQLLLLNN